MSQWHGQRGSALYLDFYQFDQSRALIAEAKSIAEYSLSLIKRGYLSSDREIVLFTTVVVKKLKKIVLFVFDHFKSVGKY